MAGKKRYLPGEVKPCPRCKVPKPLTADYYPKRRGRQAFTYCFPCTRLMSIEAYWRRAGASPEYIAVLLARAEADPTINQPGRSKGRYGNRDNPEVKRVLDYRAAHPTAKIPEIAYALKLNKIAVRYILEKNLPTT